MGAMIAGGCGRGEHAVEWGYAGPGAPENWAALSEEYATCANGEQQSPIDISGYVTAETDRPILFSYVSNANAVRNDGKFVHVDYAPGNILTVGQQPFTLESAHFHSPSEHRIDGVSFAAELHLVHADADGNLAVVGLLFTLGEPSPVVQEVLDAAPPAGKTSSEGFALNASGFAPEELGYYRYDGSKTTPPCDEPVDWYVMREPRPISAEQVNGLLALNGGPNNRPIQTKGNRIVTAGGSRRHLSKPRGTPPDVTLTSANILLWA